MGPGEAVLGRHLTSVSCLSPESKMWLMVGWSPASQGTGRLQPQAPASSVTPRSHLPPARTRGSPAASDVSQGCSKRELAELPATWHLRQCSFPGGWILVLQQAPLSVICQWTNQSAPLVCSALGFKEQRCVQVASSHRGLS